MPSIALGRGDVIIGVDTHKNEHVAVAIDGLGGRLGDLNLPANPGGYAQMVAWPSGSGPSPGSASRAPALMAAGWPVSYAATVTT